MTDTANLRDYCFRILFITLFSATGTINFQCLGFNSKTHLSFYRQDSSLYILQIFTSVDSQKSTLKVPDKIFSFKSRVKLDEELEKQLKSFRDRGFLLANIDSIKEIIEPASSVHPTVKKINIKAFFYPGTIYRWGNIRIIQEGNFPENSLYRKISKVKGKPVSEDELNKTEHQLLNFAENHGYPFAQLFTDSVRTKSNKLSLRLNIITGRKIIFDSLDIKGTSKTRKKYWMKKLGIYPDKEYNEQKIQQIPIIVKKVSFTKLVRKPEVSFYQDKAIVHLRVEDIPSNFFDGIIGFAPSGEIEKRIQLTGELTLGLRNLWGTGKSMDAEWRKTNRFSQELILSYKHPQLLTPHLEADLDFSIHKYDTLYNDILRKLTLIQQTGLNTSIHLFGEFFSSRIISTNGLNKNILPSYVDFDRDDYGLGAAWDNTDNLFYPRKGISSLLSASAGKKNIVQNSFFNPEAYSKIPGSTTNYKYKFKSSCYITPGKNVTIRNQLVAGKIMSDKLFYNDLFRLGGFNTLRGFDEKKFAAEEYAVYTLELQYYWEENSYFLIFAEPSYYKGLSVSGQVVADKPVGTGAGLSFKAAAGVFSFVYALGKDENQPMSLDFSKIHFGFTSRF